MEGDAPLEDPDAILVAPDEEAPENAGQQNGNNENAREMNQDGGAGGADRADADGEFDFPEALLNMLTAFREQGINVDPESLRLFKDADELAQYMQLCFGTQALETVTEARRQNRTSRRSRESPVRGRARRESGEDGESHGRTTRRASGSAAPSRESSRHRGFDPEGVERAEEHSRKRKEEAELQARRRGAAVADESAREAARVNQVPAARRYADYEEEARENMGLYPIQKALFHALSNGLRNMSDEERRRTRRHLDTFIGAEGVEEAFRHERALNVKRANAALRSTVADAIGVVGGPPPKLDAKYKYGANSAESKRSLDTLRRLFSTSNLKAFTDKSEDLGKFLRCIENESPLTKGDFQSILQLCLGGSLWKGVEQDLKRDYPPSEILSNLLSKYGGEKPAKEHRQEFNMMKIRSKHIEKDLEQFATAGKQAHPWLRTREEIETFLIKEAIKKLEPNLAKSMRNWVELTSGEDEERGILGEFIPWHNFTLKCQDNAKQLSSDAANIKQLAAEALKEMTGEVGKVAAKPEGETEEQNNGGGKTGKGGHKGAGKSRGGGNAGGGAGAKGGSELETKMDQVCDSLKNLSTVQESTNKHLADTQKKMAETQLKIHELTVSNAAKPDMDTLLKGLSSVNQINHGQGYSPNPPPRYKERENDELNNSGEIYGRRAELVPPKDQTGNGGAKAGPLVELFTLDNPAFKSKMRDLVERGEKFGPEMVMHHHRTIRNKGRLHSGNRKQLAPVKTANNPVVYKFHPVYKDYHYPPCEPIPDDMPVIMENKGKGVSFTAQMIERYGTMCMFCGHPDCGAGNPHCVYFSSPPAFAPCGVCRLAIHLSTHCKSTLALEDK